jgi:hypothetical protein
MSLPNCGCLRPQEQGPQQAFIDDERRRGQHHQPGKTQPANRAAFAPTFHQHPAGLEQKIQNHRAEKRPAGDQVKRDVDDPFVQQAGDSKRQDQRKDGSATQSLENGVA